MKITYLLIPILFFIFTGCTTTTNTAAPKEFNAASSTGLAIGTITFEGDVPVNDIYRFFYEAQSGDKKFKKQNNGKIEIKGRENNQSAFNGDFNNKKSYIFVLELNPGSYAFTHYNYLDHIGANGMVNTSKEFAIPFDVAAGQISYVGELSYVDKAAPGTPRIYVSGYFERDIAEIKKKYPTLNFDNTLDKTPKAGNNGNGIIDFRQ